MLSDKLSAKQMFVEHRKRLDDAYGNLIERWGHQNEGHAAGELAVELNHLLMLHAEVVQAPLLYTLQSAAEVGFAHAGPRIIEAAKEPSNGNT